MGKFYDIDPETCSMEELRAAINNCENKEEFYHTMEQSTKVFINSVYGAMASQYYVCSNIAIAESITLQGQDLIKYSVIVLNKYFRDMWKYEYKTHDLIARCMKEKFPDFDVEDFKERCKAGIELSEGDTLQVYGDTDSAYISVQPVIEACGIKTEMETDFVLAINKYILETYLADMFEKYAEMYNCDKNLEAFELEKVARSVIMLAKKKYIMDISWKEPDVHVAPLHSIVYKGIEVIQGSTPAFCRDMMKDFIKFMLNKLNTGEKPSYDAIIKKLKEIKTKFTLQSPNEISKSFGMSDYEKYVLDDKKTLTFTDAVTPIHVRAAAYYNHMLYNKAKKYKSKYNTIKKGDKVKFYYTADKSVFAFLPNEFPIEFAPKMDIDEQFEKMVLGPLNRIIVVSGYPEVSGTLTYAVGLW